MAAVVGADVVRTSNESIAFRFRTGDGAVALAMSEGQMFELIDRCAGTIGAKDPCHGEHAIAADGWTIYRSDPQTLIFGFRTPGGGYLPFAVPTELAGQMHVMLGQALRPRRS
jgi:hypothetical protein